MTEKEQKKAAAEFAKRWQGKGYEKGESQTFWLELLTEVFGVKDFALGAKIHVDLARPVIRVMEARGVIRSLGKEGRSLRFSRS